MRPFTARGRTHTVMPSGCFGQTFGTECWAGPTGETDAKPRRPAESSTDVQPAAERLGPPDEVSAVSAPSPCAIRGWEVAGVNSRGKTHRG